MKRYWILAGFGFAVLAFASVWMGGLNQDEGWYLYAARLVSEGEVPYRDFFYTQAPVMPIFYSAFTPVWNEFGLLGARIFTILLGSAGVAMLCALAARLAPEGRRSAAALVVFFVLGSNLYHLYYIAIPKTYALASLFVAVGFYLLSFANERGAKGAVFAASSGVALAFAAGTRISLGILLAVVGLALLVSFRRLKWSFLWFGAGGGLALFAVYGAFLADPSARSGLVAAQAYHAARGGFDPMFTVGSLSRLVRWYVPLFVVLGLGIAGLRRGVVPFVGWLAAASFAAVFAVQMLAPFPYEDYQVPVMGLLAVFAAISFVSMSPSEAQVGQRRSQTTPKPGSPADLRILLVLGLAWACAFGNPLLEQWKTNGQDRLWSLKKDKTELQQLRDVARQIEEEDPNGEDILTQDLYLAIEAGRKVPKGLEMGPFSMLADDEWRDLLSSAPCRLAALSGYSFAIDPPSCRRMDAARQFAYWNLLKKNYELVAKEDNFGQNATPLLILKRKEHED